MSHIVGTQSLFISHVDARKQKSESFSPAESLLAEKKQLECDIQTIQISFQNLHQRYEDMKVMYEQMKIVQITVF